MRLVLVAVMAVVAFAPASTVRAAVGEPISSAAFTAQAGSYYPGEGGREPLMAFDGSGLTGDVHADSGEYAYSAWMSQTGMAYLMVDMQTTQTIGQINIWNYKEAGLYAGPNGTDRGAKTVEIWYALAGATIPTAGGSDQDPPCQFTDTTGWTKLMTIDLNPATLSGAASDMLDVMDFQAQYVLFNVLSQQNSAQGGNAGISEIQFLQGQMPEPATSGLVALGGLALLIRRRRTQV